MSIESGHCLARGAAPVRVVALAITLSFPAPAAAQPQLRVSSSFALPSYAAPAARTHLTARVRTELDVRKRQVSLGKARVPAYVLHNLLLLHPELEVTLINRYLSAFAGAQLSWRASRQLGAGDTTSSLKLHLVEAGLKAAVRTEHLAAAMGASAGTGNADQQHAFGADFVAGIGFASLQVGGSRLALGGTARVVLLGSPATVYLTQAPGSRGRIQASYLQYGASLTLRITHSSALQAEVTGTTHLADQRGLHAASQQRWDSTLGTTLEAHAGLRLGSAEDGWTLGLAATVPLNQIHRRYLGGLSVELGLWL